MRRLLIVVFAILLISGCADVPDQLLADSVCRKAAIALNTLTTLYMADELSEKDAQIVDQLDASLRPLCTGPTRPTTEVGIYALSDTATQLLLMQGRYGDE